MRPLLTALISMAAVVPAGAQTPNEPTHVVFIHGGPSHGRGSHEHRAGSLLLSRHLERAFDEAVTTHVVPIWPDVELLANADALVILCDGGGRHPVVPRLEEVDALMKKGIGLACLHYAVEVPKGDPGDHMLRWLGGYFETHWSVNPHWKATFEWLPDHPITRGVEPFDVQDEWYYHMRFRGGMDGVTPILSALPPDKTLERKDGPHQGNPHVRAAVGRDEPQHVAWAHEREDGGRGFGFTGLHFHHNLAQDDYRRLLLNAIAWTAKLSVPEKGVMTATPTKKEMEQDLDG